MISKKLEEALNAQVNAEFYSAYLYLSMSADFAVKGLPGFAHWMKVQFKEEQDHAQKLFNYIIARGGAPKLMPIEGVKTSWANALEVYTDTLAHERTVTEAFNNLYKVATEENDFAGQSFLKWFIDEQVEEEENVISIIDALKLIGDNGYGLYSMDKDLSSRVFVSALNEKE